jgi:nitroreductase
MRAVEVPEALRRRRMVRSFTAQAVPAELVARLVDDALRAPTAGHSRGVHWLVLQEPADRDRFWTTATDPGWRDRARRWPGLRRAPVLALAWCSPEAYTARYAEADKAGAGLEDEAAWDVPYWFGDAAFSTMALLLGAVDAGLGAAFVGNHRQEAALAGAFGVPAGWRWFGVVLLGHAAAGDPRSPSLDRPGPGRADRVHLGRW